MLLLGPVITSQVISGKRMAGLRKRYRSIERWHKRSRWINLGRTKVIIIDSGAQAVETLEAIEALNDVQKTVGQTETPDLFPTLDNIESERQDD